MENKKYLPIKIVHLILLIASLVMSVIALIKYGSTDTIYTASAFPAACTVTNIAALVVGFIYLIKGYKKNANWYYKAFMRLCVLYEILLMTCLSQFVVPYYNAFVYMVSTVMIVVLAVGKDLGKRETYIFFVVMLVCQLIPLVMSLRVLTYFGSSAFGMLSQEIANILNVGTIGFMIAGKYIDKSERGTE